MKPSRWTRLIAGVTVMAVLLATTPGAAAAACGFANTCSEKRVASDGDHECPCCSCSSSCADDDADRDLDAASDQHSNTPCPFCPGTTGGCSFCSVAKVPGFLTTTSFALQITSHGCRPADEAELYSPPFRGILTPPPKA